MADKKQNNRNKFMEDSNKSHIRAKSYFTGRKIISNMLPQKLEVKNRLSHSVEIKRITIVRGDKYKNIQIMLLLKLSILYTMVVLDNKLLHRIYNQLVYSYLIVS